MQKQKTPAKRGKTNVLFTLFSFAPKGEVIKVANITHSHSSLRHTRANGRYD
jgi:hypothetical protein